MSNSIFLISKRHSDIKSTITFDSNGGECSVLTKDVYIGKTVGDLPTPVYSDKYFYGWFTDRTFSTQVYSYTVVTNDIDILYAKWLDPVSIDFDAETNGGTLIPYSYKYYEGIEFGNLPDATGPATSSIMDGWWTTSGDGGTEITESSIVTDVRKYYAHFRNDIVDDPIGNIICTTRNLKFEKADRGTVDGCIVIETDSAYWYSGVQDSVYLTDIEDDENQTTLYTTVTGPGELSFRVKVSTEENWDGVVFLMDDNYNSSIYENTREYVTGAKNNPPYIYSTGSGEIDWTQHKLIIPSGEHTLYFVFTHDEETEGKNKVWLADVNWVKS